MFEVSPRYSYLPDVDAGVRLAKGVAVAQVGDGGDGVKTRVLRKDAGDHLEGLGEGSGGRRRRRSWRRGKHEEMVPKEE